MTDPDQMTDDAIAAAGEVADIAQRHDLTVAVAESLTGGKIACHLGAAPSSSIWFRGGVVAYAAEVKVEVLGVPPGPVVTEGCARAMARGVGDLLGADLSVAVTGVGGPDAEEGQPAGTVWFGVVAGSREHAERRHFGGPPDEILAATTSHALALLRDAARTAAAVAPAGADPRAIPRASADPAVAPASAAPAGDPARAHAGGPAGDSTGAPAGDSTGDAPTPPEAR